MAEDSKKSVLDRVIGVIVEVLNVDAKQVSTSSNIKSDLGADSLDLMTLVVALEEEFDGKIPDEEMTNINTVGDAVNLIQKEILKTG